MFKFFAYGTKQNKEFMFWQKTNHPIELYTNEVIDQKINYRYLLTRVYFFLC